MRWQEALSQAISDPAELIELLELDPSYIEPARQAASLFPLRVPRGFVNRMKKNDINDPLLKQVLPLEKEHDAIPGYVADPVGDQFARKMPGLLHKYHGRILLTLTGACAIHCRYCFRREFPYADNRISREQWQNILAYIKDDPSIEEVIFSGGDPLVSADHQLKTWIEDLAELPQIKRLRLHTRLPIVLPERINSELITALTATRLMTIIVIHCNHANEIDTTVVKALNALNQAGITLLNQAVLLKGVNDNVKALVDLHKTLFEHHVLPYYLHMFDPVRGAAHFDCSRQDALKIYTDLQSQLPGYLVPRLVQEIAGKSAKTLVTLNDSII